MDERKEPLQTIEEWLDEKIAAYILFGKEFNPTEGEGYYKCPRVINVHTPDKAIHVCHINKIVKQMKDNVVLMHETLKPDRDGNIWHEYYFMYKGYRFFEVEKEEK